jgi:hypothetical protein
VSAPARDERRCPAGVSAAPATFATLADFDSGLPKAQLRHIQFRQTAIVSTAWADKKPVLPMAAANSSQSPCRNDCPEAVVPSSRSAVRNLPVPAQRTFSCTHPVFRPHERALRWRHRRP